MKIVWEKEKRTKFLAVQGEGKSSEGGKRGQWEERGRGRAPRPNFFKPEGVVVIFFNSHNVTTK